MSAGVRKTERVTICVRVAYLRQNGWIGVRVSVYLRMGERKVFFFSSLLHRHCLVFSFPFYRLLFSFCVYLYVPSLLYLFVFTIFHLFVFFILKKTHYGIYFTSYILIHRHWYLYCNTTNTLSQSTMNALTNDITFTYPYPDTANRSAFPSPEAGARTW